LVTSPESPSRTKSKKPLERPQTRKKVEAWIVEGLPNTEIARRVGVHHSAVAKFRHRHEDSIQPIVAEVERQIIDYAIANKVNRIAELQHFYDLTRKEVDEYGIIVVETRTETDGEGVHATTTVIETRDYRSSLVKEARGILRQVSEELDQLPRSSTINIDNRTQIVIRDYGIDTRSL